MFGKRKKQDRKGKKLSLERERLRPLQELSSDELDQVGGGKNVPGAGGYGRSMQCWNEP